MEMHLNPERQTFGTPVRLCPHCKCEMECVDEERRAYLCELCLHETCEEDEATAPKVFKSRAALNKWQRKARKAIKVAAKNFRAAAKGKRRKKKK